MKEHSDGIEREYKFHWSGSEEQALDTLRTFQAPGRVLLKHLPRARLDVYLDHPSLTLLRSGASVRLRKRLSKSGWSVNFKPASEPGPEFMARREIRTTVTSDEALSAHLPGLAAAECYRLIESLTGDASAALAPIVCLYTNRSIYTLTDHSGWPPRDEDNRCYISFDEVTAVDIRGIDLTSLVGWQILDCSRPVGSACFGVLEIDAAGVLVEGFWDHDARTIALLESIGEALKATHQVVQKNKYQQACELLMPAEAVLTG